MDVKAFIDEVFNFVKEHGDGLIDKRNQDEYRKFLNNHFKYGTLLIMKDDKGISAFCRWNFIDGYNIHILDVVMRKDIRSMVALKELLATGIRNHPYGNKVDYLIFERENKYSGKPQKRYTIHEFLKRRR